MVEALARREDWPGVSNVLVVTVTPGASRDSLLFAVIGYWSIQLFEIFEQRLSCLLIAQRGKLHADSDQTQRLDMEIAAVRDLVRSYRIVKALSSQ